MTGYTKDFLIEAFLSRYSVLGPTVLGVQKVLAEQLYDEVGKDKFRVYASLDADAIKLYKAPQK